MWHNYLIWATLRNTHVPRFLENEKIVEKIAQTFSSVRVTGACANLQFSGQSQKLKIDAYLA